VDLPQELGGALEAAGLLSAGGSDYTAFGIPREELIALFTSWGIVSI